MLRAARAAWPPVDNRTAGTVLNPCVPWRMLDATTIDCDASSLRCDIWRDDAKTTVATTATFHKTIHCVASAHDAHDAATSAENDVCLEWLKIAT